MSRSVRLRLHDTTCYELDKWCKEQDVSLERVLEAVMSLMRRAEFQRGYAAAQADQNAERLAQEARERNGGEEPTYHNCHFCGDLVANGYDAKGDRHWLSDCRPDLVEHEEGETCTWAYLLLPENAHLRAEGQPSCYAYQERKDLPYEKWHFTKEHIHFDEDGPM